MSLIRLAAPLLASSTMSGCFLWIPPRGVDGTDARDTDAPDTDAPDTDGADTDGADTDREDTDADDTDTEQPPPTWRALLVHIATRTDGGGIWVRASVCIDGRLAAPWYSTWTDTAGGCQVISSPPRSCLDGSTVDVSLTGLGEPIRLPWDPAYAEHAQDIHEPAARTAFGLTTTAWPDGPGALDIDDALIATPHAMLLTGDRPASIDFTRDIDLRWTPAGADGVLVSAIGAGPPYAVVRCVVADTGQLTVPASLFSGWDPQTVSVDISQAFVSPAIREGDVVTAAVALHRWSGYSTLE